MRCLQCNGEIPAKARFCPECGAGIGQSDTKPPGGAKAAGFRPGGRVLDRYEIVCELGRGGMGVVYQAIDHVRGADVALKTVPDEMRRDGRALLNLRREVNTALELTHENICRVHDLQDAPEGLFISMQLINGKSLDRILEEEFRKGREGLPLDTVQRVLGPVCAALDYAHAKSIIHRDLKPGNVMVARDGAVKVLDFGLARVVRATMSRYSREAVSGTILYMSPEQCLGKPADARSDIYSLGMLAWELFTGRAPFADAGDITYCQLHEDLPRAPGLPEQVNAALAAATAKDPKERPASASAFLRMLREPQSTVEVAGGREPEAQTRRAEEEPAELPMVTPENAVERQRQTAPDGKTERKIQLAEGVILDLMWIPPGSFMMGTSESPEDILSAYGGEDDWKEINQRERPRHRVTLTRGFWLATKAVTVCEFGLFVDATSYRTDAEQAGKGWVFVPGGTGSTEKEGVTWRNPDRSTNPEEPVVLVSWNDAVAYCEWLSRTTGAAYRLPTEAEWEYACRAGTTTQFWWGDRAEDGKGKLNAADQTALPDGSLWKYRFPFSSGYWNVAPVGNCARNPWNLRDMLGNVWEWCQDWYGNYSRWNQADPDGPASGQCRVIRGGSWANNPINCRAAYRIGVCPGRASAFIGFRVARTP